MEQVRHRVSIRLIADPNKLLKALGKVSFRQCEIINSELAMVRGARNKITLNKPIAVGFCILEISKLIMYKFYYEVLKAKFGDRCSLLFTDTDSLCCEIRTRDLNDDFADMADELDTSNFDSAHPCTRKPTVECWGSPRARRGRCHQRNSWVSGQKCIVCGSSGKSRRVSRRQRASRNTT